VSIGIHEHCSAREFEINVKENSTQHLRYCRPNPVATGSKAWVCGRSLAGLVGSNPADGTVVCRECSVLSGKGLITRPEEAYGQWCVIVSDLEPP
jgi:hypothetical protein